MDTKLLKIRAALDDTLLQQRVAGAQLAYITTNSPTEGSAAEQLANAVRDNPSQTITNFVTEMVLNPSIQTAIVWDEATSAIDSTAVTDSDIEYVVADRWTAVAERLYGTPATSI
ncbi:hypothetical protein [Zhihengliuella flava]|uniref:Uncharacterized protein n=1 Tax=Zhihengliuella flava TaxID=1285193 RepID=A0A931GG01_9MICC|nr:hypothetical protein [Zhihengliuella flava]MBG6085805.1 hypothetical protein [Zhihengliuella flava]MBG6085883.1 hypothetical protein [Zhihengliuella flava]